MQKKCFALVGNCRMADGLELGVTVLEYLPGDGDMRLLGRYARELNVGNQLYDQKRKLLYVVNEFWSQPGRTGGGGNVAVFSLEPSTGALVQKDICRTFGANPSYLALDKSGKFLLVTHHCTDHFVTKIVASAGGYDSVTEYDLCTVLLYELREDGSIGALADVYEVPGHDQKGKHTFPHLHCVVPDPQGGWFIVCDKGLDKIYCFAVDAQRKKLVKVSEADGAPGSEPRYCNFHPNKPIFYTNCESSPMVNAYGLNRQTGEIRLLGGCSCLGGEDCGEISPSDIVVHPTGRFVFSSIRVRNLITVFRIGEDGLLSRHQTVDCGGKNPRGLCISPDARFLMAANVESGSVTVFEITPDGTLTLRRTVEMGGFPGNIQILSEPDCEE